MQDLFSKPTLTPEQYESCVVPLTVPSTNDPTDPAAVKYDLDKLFFIDGNESGKPDISTEAEALKYYKRTVLNIDSSLYVVKRKNEPATNAVSTWQNLADITSSFLGARTTPPRYAGITNPFWYNTRNHYWYYLTIGESWAPVHITDASILGQNAIWLNEHETEQEAANAITNYDSTKTYYALINGQVRRLDSNGFTASTVPHYSYKWINVVDAVRGTTIRGIWNSEYEYHEGEGVFVHGFGKGISFSLTDGNIGNNPETDDGTNWINLWEENLAYTDQARDFLLELTEDTADIITRHYETGDGRNLEVGYILNGNFANRTPISSDTPVPSGIGSVYNLYVIFPYADITSSEWTLATHTHTGGNPHYVSGTVGLGNSFVDSGLKTDDNRIIYGIGASLTNLTDFNAVNVHYSLQRRRPALRNPLLRVANEALDPTLRAKIAQGFRQDIIYAAGLVTSYTNRLSTYGTTVPDPDADPPVTDDDRVSLITGYQFSTYSELIFVVAIPGMNLYVTNIFPADTFIHGDEIMINTDTRYVKFQHVSDTQFFQAAGNLELVHIYGIR